MSDRRKQKAHKNAKIAIEENFPEKVVLAKAAEEEQKAALSEIKNKISDIIEQVSQGKTTFNKASTKITHKIAQIDKQLESKDLSSSDIQKLNDQKSEYNTLLILLQEQIKIAQKARQDKEDSVNQNEDEAEAQNDIDAMLEKSEQVDKIFNDALKALPNSLSATEQKLYWSEAIGCSFLRNIASLEDANSQCDGKPVNISGTSSFYCCSSDALIAYGQNPMTDAEILHLLGLDSTDL